MMASALPPLAPPGGLPHLHDSGSVVAKGHGESQPGAGGEPRPQRKIRHIRSAAPRLATRNPLSELGQRFQSIPKQRERQDSARSSHGSSTAIGISTSNREPRWKTSASSVDVGHAAGTARPHSSQARPSSAMKGAAPDRKRSISAPGSLQESASQYELPRIQRPSSAMPRLTSGISFQPNSLSLSRPTSATGRSRPSPTSHQVFDTLLEEEYDEMSEEAFLADMNEEEFEEWIAAQERGDRAKIAALRRLLIIKKLGIDARDAAQDWRSGVVAIPDFHCEHCRNHWLQHHKLPDECPEERRKRLAREAEEQRRRRGGSAQLKRRSKRSKKHGDENGYEYEEYVSEDGTVQRRRKTRRGGGLDGEDDAEGGGGAGRGKGHRGIAEVDESGYDAMAGGGGGSGGGDGGNRSGKGDGVGGDGRGGGTGGGAGTGTGQDQFIGADGKLYTGGSVSGDFQLDGIPNYERNKAGHTGDTDGTGSSLLGSDGTRGKDGRKRRGSSDSRSGQGPSGGSVLSDFGGKLQLGQTSSAGAGGTNGTGGLHGDVSSDPFGKGDRGGVGYAGGGDGSGRDDSDGDGSQAGGTRAGRRYGRNRGQAEGECAGGNGADGVKHGRRSRRGSVVDDSQKDGAAGDGLVGKTRSGNASPDEDADGRYGGKGGQFGRRFHRRTSKSEVPGLAPPDDFSRNLQLEEIRNLFTAPWSFSYFTGKVDVDDSGDES